jgi:prepilin signal peptidase PulO-like enzyme (type II secretory pathway)
VIYAIAAPIFYASIAIIAIAASRAVCKDIAPEEDGAPSGRPPYVILVVASAIVGELLMYWHAMPLQLGIAAMVLFALVACWCSDAVCGIVPDAFTLAPLAALLLFSFAQRDWGMMISAAVVFVPFALAAFFSHGRGMGWGDVKLVALSGAALGAPLVVFALAAVCGVAAVVHHFSRARRGPIAFAPYIAAFTGIALPLGLAR